MQPPILVTMDSNEDQSKNQRSKACQYVIGQSQGYSWEGFGELPVDMRMQLPCSAEVCDDCERENVDCSYNTVHVELKEISDFWSSKGTGHLGQQIMTMIQEGQPGFVAVFGSLQEVMAQVPKVKMDGRPKARTRQDIAGDINTARALCADAAACGVPLFFLSTNYKQSFAWILSMAKNILTGPNMASWLPRFPVDPQGYSVLCSINGIGDVAAKGLLQAYGGIGQIANECKHNPEALAACKVNGKALGPAKARKLAEVFG
jgi:ERCC4-type nuclease